MAILTTATVPKSNERITAPVASDLRQLEIQFNNMIAWNAGPGILGIAAGSRGAAELAEFVRKGAAGM
jgi:hypothetical protein